VIGHVEPVGAVAIAGRAANNLHAPPSNNDTFKQLVARLDQA
jgi:hypothetical protein